MTPPPLPGEFVKPKPPKFANRAERDSHYRAKALAGTNKDAAKFVGKQKNRQSTAADELTISIPSNVVPVLFAASATVSGVVWLFRFVRNVLAGIMLAVILAMLLGVLIA